MTLLTDAQRAALEAFRATWDACETTASDSYEAEAVLEAIGWPFTREDGFAYRLYDIAGWLLATDARLRAESARCPHVTGSDEGTQWCRLGETTAAADAALARIGAHEVTGRRADSHALSDWAMADDDIMRRARQLVAEGGVHGR